MRRFVLVYGFIAGGVLAAMMVITGVFHRQIPIEAGEVIGYTTMVLAFLMVFFGVRSYREEVGGGTVSFGRALGVGLGITLVAAICYVAAWEVVLPTLMADFPERYQAHLMEQARASGATEAELARKAQELAGFWQQYQNPLVRIGFTFLEPLPVGLVFSLLTAWIMSRRRPTHTPDSAPAPKPAPPHYAGGL